MARVVKRPAAKVEAPPSKRAKNAKAAVAETPHTETPRKRPKDPTQQRIDEVVAALGDGALMQTSTSPVVLDMLAKGLHHSLNVPAEERHSMQATVLEHVKEVLADAASGSKVRRTRAAEAKVAEAAALGETQEAKLNTAIEAAKASERIVEDCRQACADQEAAIKSLKQQLSAAYAKQKELDRERTMHQKQKDKLFDIKDNHFQVLVDGTSATEKEAKKLCDKLVKEMEKLGTEESLVDSVPAVLLKKASERGGFDDMVISTFRDSLTAASPQAAAGRASETLVQAESERAGKEEARRAEEAALEASRAATQLRRNELDAMQALEAKLQEVTGIFLELVSRSAATVAAEEGDATEEKQVGASPAVSSVDRFHLRRYVVRVVVGSAALVAARAAAAMTCAPDARGSSVGRQDAALIERICRRAQQADACAQERICRGARAVEGGLLCVRGGRGRLRQSAAVGRRRARHVRDAPQQRILEQHRGGAKKK
eukprot:CAMPEP_0170446922 /NCGR_PEP_ID=MMETSP0117_2-20130122/49877_1 /TAXON_ID=400756 /ORGANISM="Durinskia baltica, Strain CSIRO CS-38" /LENGTH=487 /DNA_ID=CAMNT_0010707945 /DNA_START=50 /DNA_END=1511 /DNA_ORIENTATION=-